MIDQMSAKAPDTCLNLKSEWGQSRTPALVNKERPLRKKPERCKGGKARERNEAEDEDHRQEGNGLEEGRLEKGRFAVRRDKP